MTRKIRAFGTSGWELVVADLASGTKQYVNKVTGEIEEDPPDEVLQILAAENSMKIRRQKPLYEPTPYRFAPLNVTKEVRNQVQFADQCCCCSGAGVIEHYGVCPLCDGDCVFYSDDDQSNPDAGISVAMARSDTGSFPIEKVDLLCGYWGYDGACFLLRNLLTPSECQAIIDQAEGFGLQHCGYSKRMRITDRVSVMAGELGDLLFTRAKPYLPDMHISCDLPMLPAGLPQGIPMAGKKRHWSATELNPCFRICRYKPGGFFQPHHDGGFDYNSEHRSFKTFMLYLNDDFEGGSTSFYKESQRHYHTPDPAKVMHDLRPERGSCVVFNHHITHDGGVLTKGQKYILRTEVMYELS
jgi:hypothetical protein